MSTPALFADPNPGTTRSNPVATVVQSVKSNSGINQIRGTDNSGSTGNGIPKHVTNVGVSSALASQGTTTTLRVTFHRDPSDKSYSSTAILVKGYQGNNNAVQVATSSESPATVVLNNTGEPVSLVAQATGNGGSAPLASAPTTGIQLPQSTVSGYGTSTTTAYTPSSPPPSSGATLSTPGQGWFIGAGSKDQSPLLASFDSFVTNRGANVVVVCQFVLDATWVLSKVSYALQTAAASSNFNFGIYSASGGKLIDSGAFDGSITTAQTNSFAPVTLTPGVYYLAFSETSGGTLQGPIMELAAATITKFLSYFTSTTPFVGTAANATSGNVLPATLGTITAASSGWFQGLPICVWQV